MTWHRESYRHSLAAKGVHTNRYSMAYAPTYVVGDLPLIAGDAIGTVGASAVALAPLAVTAGVVYWGGKKIKKDIDEAKKKKSFARVDAPYYDDVAMGVIDRRDLGKRLGFGRDRIVFELGKDRDKVIKIALNPTGLKQNRMELEDVGLKPIFHGRDFVVLERAAKTMKDKDEPGEHGISWEQLNAAKRQMESLYPESAAGDVSRLSSWGFDKEGKLVLLDKGALDKHSLRMRQEDIDDWNERIAARRVALRGEGKERLVQMMDLGRKERQSDIWPEGYTWAQWDLRPRLRRARTDPKFLESERAELPKVLRDIEERRIQAGLEALG